MLKYKKSSYRTIFSPDETRLINIGGGVSLFDMNQDEPTLMFTNNALTNPSYAAFSPDMKKIAASNTSGRLELIDSATGELLQKNRGVGAEGNQIHFIDDTHVLTCGWNGKVGLWDTVSNKLDIRMDIDGRYRLWPAAEQGEFILFREAREDLGMKVKYLGFQISLVNLITGKSKEMYCNIGEKEPDSFFPVASNVKGNKYYSYQGESRWKKELYYDCFELVSRTIVQEKYSLKKPFPIGLLATDRERIIWHVDDMGLATFLDPATKGAIQLNLGMISCDSVNFYGKDRLVIGDYDYLSFTSIDELPSFRSIKKNTKAKMPPKAKSTIKEKPVTTSKSAFTSLHKFLYKELRDLIETWSVNDIFAIGIYLYPDECMEDEENTDMEEFTIRCGCESDFKDNSEVEKWNPSEWGRAQDIKLGEMGPVKLKKLLKVLTEVAFKLQQEDYLKQKYQRPIPFIFCEFEPTGRSIEATTVANPHGEADEFLSMV